MIVGKSFIICSNRISLFFEKRDVIIPCMNSYYLSNTGKIKAYKVGRGFSIYITFKFQVELIYQVTDQQPQKLNNCLHKSEHLFATFGGHSCITNLPLEACGV